MPIILQVNFGCTRQVVSNPFIPLFRRYLHNSAPLSSPCALRAERAVLHVVLLPPSAAPLTLVLMELSRACCFFFVVLWSGCFSYVIAHCIRIVVRWRSQHSAPRDLLHACLRWPRSPLLPSASLSIHLHAVALFVVSFKLFRVRFHLPLCPLVVYCSLIPVSGKDTLRFKARPYSSSRS